MKKGDKNKIKGKKLYVSPLFIAIIARAFGLFGTIIGGLLNFGIENKRQEGSMILEAVKLHDEDKSASRLLFLADAGLVELSQQQIKNIKDHASIENESHMVKGKSSNDVSEIKNATVGIYTEKDKGIRLFTGFYIDPDGTILTVYHGIEGSNSISVLDSDGSMWSNVDVTIVYPDCDLAMLHVDHGRQKINNLSFDATNYPNICTSNLDVVGHPNGIPFANFKFRLVADNYINSKTIHTSSGNMIFEKNIDMLLVEGMNYNGMAGAPIVCNGRVVGVFSGSLGEGTTIGWAIPVKYLEMPGIKFHEGIAVADIIWPHLTLYKVVIKP